MNEESKLKLKDLQKFVSPLSELMKIVKNDPSKADNIKHLEVIHKVLTETEISIRIDILEKCEEILKKVFEKSLNNDCDSPDTSNKNDVNNDLCDLGDMLSTYDKENNKIESQDNSRKINNEKDSSTCCEDVTSDLIEISSEENITDVDHGKSTDEIVIDKESKNDKMEVEEKACENNSKKDRHEEIQPTVEQDATISESKKDNSISANEELKESLMNKINRRPEKNTETQASDEQSVLEEKINKIHSEENDKICELDSINFIDTSKGKANNSITNKEHMLICDERFKIPESSESEDEYHDRKKIDKVLNSNNTQEKNEESEKYPIKKAIKCDEENDDNIVIGNENDNEQNRNVEENTLQKIDKNEHSETEELGDVVKEKELKDEKEIKEEEKEKDEIEDDDDDDLLVAMKSSPIDSNLEERGVKIEPQRGIVKSSNNEMEIVRNELQSHRDKDVGTTIKAIELKPKDPSEKSTVVYLVKKNVPKQMEIIDLLDSEEEDDDDDDVIFISEKGLKKQTTIPKPIVAKHLVSTSKLPQPKILNSRSSAGSFQKTKNKPLFAITSVKSISQHQQQQRKSTVTSVNNQANQRKNSLPSTQLKPSTSQHQINTNQRKNSLPSTQLKPSTSQLINTILAGKSRTITCNSTFTPSNCNNLSTTIPIRGTLNKTNLNIESINTEATEEGQKSREAVESFVSNLLNPIRSLKTDGISLLLTVLDFTNFCRIRRLIEKVRRTIVMSQNDKNSISNIQITTMQKEIRALFIKNNAITEIGHKLASILMKNDVRNSTKSRKKIKNKEDSEYAPSVNVEFAEETVVNRRQSLRRESKTNRKQYFAYEDDDDEDFLNMLEDHAKLDAANSNSNSNKRKKVTPKRPLEVGGRAGTSQNEIKKLRVEKGFSIDTPFETDLLTPTWVEDPVDVECVEQYDIMESEQQQSDAYLPNNAENSYVTENEQQQLLEHEENVYQGDGDQYPLEDYNEEQEQNLLNIIPGSNSNFKNINRAHHCRSHYIDACLLCGIKHNFIVAHYVNNHRDTEVVISRLTQRDTDQLMKSINFGYLATTKTSAHQYSATCIFCKREMSFALRYWWEHYSMHTGEYGYECFKCGLRKPRRQHAQKHANGECKLGPSKVKIAYHFDKSANRIEAFICKLCNYIQIHKENVTRHLRTQHNLRKKLDTNMAQVVLLQISRSYQDELNNLQYESGENSYQDYDMKDENQLDFAVEFPNDMISNDDLSYRICDMLASNDTDQSGTWGIEAGRSGDVEIFAIGNNIEQNTPTQALEESST